MTDLQKNIVQQTEHKEIDDLTNLINKMELQPKTLFWAVDLGNKNSDQYKKIYDLEQINKIFTENTKLKKQPELHSTFLFLGGKVDYNTDETEKLLIPIENYEFFITVDSVGVSDNAIALNVKDLYFIYQDERIYFVKDGEKQKNSEIHFNTIPIKVLKQHITLGLVPPKPAAESVNTLLGEGTIITLDTELTLTGNLKRYPQFLKKKLKK